MTDLNASRLLEDTRAAARNADTVLNDEKSDKMTYGEALADLHNAFDLLDSWLTDTEGKDLPVEWTNPNTPPAPFSPF